jgi:hypothetical protein
MIWKLSRLTLWSLHSKTIEHTSPALQASNRYQADPNVMPSKKFGRSLGRSLCHTAIHIPCPEKKSTPSLFLRILLLLLIVKGILLYFEKDLITNSDRQSPAIDKFFFLKSTIYTDPFLVHTLYQMMKDTHELFDAAGITYWVDWGTALGALRHKGLIPWDDDLDVNILQKDAKRLEELAPILNQLGYQLYPVSFGYRISPIIAPKQSPSSFHSNDLSHYPSLDIFLFEPNQLEDCLCHATKSGKEKWPNNTFSSASIENRTLQDFGSFQIYVCQQMGIELDKHFGPDWRTTAVYFHRHMSNFTPPPLRWELSKEEYVPAKPTDTLKDRVKGNILILQQLSKILEPNETASLAY